jgi:carbonic anhydrase/acetyltransferase-like protein (isoleucine patch superfamily)
MIQKYEFVAGDELNIGGRVLKRIRALIAIPRHNVAIGDFGGYLESESNLSHEGDAWVYGRAQVCGRAWVGGNARVYGNALVFDNALVYGDAVVGGDALVYGDAEVYGNAEVGGNAEVYDDEVN